jgi:hypothetical protein
MHTEGRWLARAWQRGPQAVRCGESAQVQGSGRVRASRAPLLRRRGRRLWWRSGLAGSRRRRPRRQHALSMRANFASKPQSGVAESGKGFGQRRSVGAAARTRLAPAELGLGGGRAPGACAGASAAAGRRAAPTGARGMLKKVFGQVRAGRRARALGARFVLESEAPPHAGRAFGEKTGGAAPGRARRRRAAGRKAEPGPAAWRGGGSQGPRARVAGPAGRAACGRGPKCAAGVQKAVSMAVQGGRGSGKPASQSKTASIGCRAAARRARPLGTRKGKCGMGIGATGWGGWGEALPAGQGRPVLANGRGEVWGAGVLSKIAAEGRRGGGLFGRGAGVGLARGLITHSHQGAWERVAIR